MIDLGRIAKQLRHRPIRATGGEISDVIINGKRYKVHTFLSSGQLTVQDGGDFEYLVVAGGGKGGNSSGSPFGGGGGAGGLRIGKLAVASGSAVSVVVGASGENSSFGTIISSRGGNGGNGISGGSQTLRNGQAGGSGGGSGGGDQTAFGLPGAGNTPATTPSQGFSGGQSRANINSAGAGGGAGGPGEIFDVSSGQNRNSLPGPGLTLNFSGEPKTYAAGGECGTNVAGAPNTGNGGSGGFNGNDGLPGGSGIVVIRYRFRYSKD
jgi:hypothetical protein